MSLADTIQWLFALAIGLFYAMIVVIGSVYTNLKNPIAFFRKQKRDSPPECLNDKSLGQHGYVKLKDVKLHYVANGQESKPLMLFVHGFPEFWYSWRYQLREFSKDYRVVAVDQRGYCDSDKPSGVENYSVDKLTDDIKQLILALGYKKCVLVGHDWGGIPCWALAALNPEVIDRLIILNIPHVYAFEAYIKRSWSQFRKSWYIFYFQIPYLPEITFGGNDWKAVASIYKGTKSVKGVDNMTEEDIEAYKYAVSRPGALTSAINYYRCSFRSRFEKKLPKIEKPTLLIWGTNDVALDTEMAAMSGEYVENFTVEYVQGGSHFVQMDRPDEVNRHMRNFLESKKT